MTWVAARTLGVLLVVVGLFVTRTISSHPVDSSTLHLTELRDGRLRVQWQTTSATLQQLRQPAQYPAHCVVAGAELDCGRLGLVGSIDFPWLRGTESRVVVIVDWLVGSRLLRVVDGRSTSIAVYGNTAAAGLRYWLPIATDYTRLGIEHILGGFDHLLFVLAITLLVRNRRTLVIAITAFTVAHSITLIATVLGWLWLPAAAVETTIALAVVLACAECLRPTDTLAHRVPWVVTFAFGLLHGMGFASALLDTGLPEGHVPGALACFRLGVELGQLLALAAFAGLGYLIARVERRPAWLSRALVYAMGTLAAYWALERGLLLLSA